MVTANSLIFKIIGDNEQFDKAVKESTAYLDDFKKKTKDVEDILAKATKQLAIMTTAVGAMGAVTVKMAVDFNKGFAQVYTLLDGGKDRLKELQDEVLNLSPTVGKATDDLTQGLYDVVSAFGDTTESTKNLELAAKAATAENASTKESVALLSAVTKAYGDTSNAAQKKVADGAFMAVKLGQTTYPELASSLQRVTSQSKILGISQEEMFAIFSSGTGVIGSAAEVSTKYSATLTELQKPGERLTKAFKELQVASGQELIEKFGGLGGAMEALKEVAEQTGEPISNIFSSAEAGKQALYLAGEGAEKFASDLDKIRKGAGAAEEAFNKATLDGPNAFGFQMNQASESAKAFAVRLGQELIPSIQTLLSPVSKLTNYLRSLDEQQIKTIASIGKIAITALGTATAVVGLALGIIKAKKAFDAVNKAMKIANAAFKMNHLGLLVVGITTAIVALKEFCDWLDITGKKQRELELQNLKSSLAIPKTAQNLISLSKAYIELAEKEKLNNEEKLKLKRQTEKLLKQHPELQGKLSLEEDAYKKNLKVLKEFNKEKIKEIELNIQNAKTAHGNIAKTIEDNKKHLKLLKETNEYITNARGDWGEYKNAKQIEKEEIALKHLIEQQKIYAEEIKKNEDLLAQLKDSTAGLEETETKNPITTSGNEPKEVSHKEQLEKLDAAYNAQMQIIKNRNTNNIQKQEEAKKAEEKYYSDRIALLEKFHTENLTKGKTFKQSQKEVVGAKNQTILEETKNTNAGLEKLADEKHKKEIDKLKNIAEETKKIIDSEIALKKEMGEIEGKDDKEKNRNAKLLEAQKLHEKRNDIMQEYLRLQNSSNEKDKEKDKILLQELDELGNLEKKALEVAGNVEKTFIEKAENFLAKVQKWGGEIANAFSNVANLAKDIIGAKEAKRKQETAQKIAEIERNKSETLLEIDDELAQMREEKQLETAEREAERREEEYQKRIADYNRNILSLEGKLQTETNLEKLRNIEQQLEDTRKKKAEEVRRKKEEKEKEKREKEARKQEVELLNARARAEHDFAVAKIETENVAGTASAKAAQEVAKWQKAQTSMSLSLKAIEQGVLASIAFAKGVAGNPLGYVEGAARVAAATMAGIQIGVVAAQPLPPDYTAQPLPPAPRPIKFAQGGIVMPSRAGTGITLPNGNPGLVAEAGVPEMIMPITAPNLENMFKAAGVTNNNNSHQNSMSYSPSFSVSVTQDAGEDLGEKILDVLRDKDRETINIIEEARQKWFV